jgi:transcriptional regulator with XRE-family HTH domain
MLENIKKTLADNLSALLERYPDISRLELSRRMEVADGTLGRIKYGTGNPQLDNLCQIADFFKLSPWQLLVKDGFKLPRDYDPFKQPVPVIEPGHVRIAVLGAVPSAELGGEPVDYPAVLGHIDVAEAWARKRLGSNLEHIRALPVAGDSMSPTINEGDLAFVDTSCNRFEAEGIYVIVFNDSMLIKRLVVDLAARRIEVRSDNAKLPTQYIAQAELTGLTICGRVKGWLAVKGY